MRDDYWDLKIIVWLKTLPVKAILVPPSSQVSGRTIDGAFVVILVKGTERLVQMISQAVSSGSTVHSKLSERVVTVHIAHTKQIVVCISLHSSEINHLNIQLLRFQGRNLVQIVQAEEEVSL